MAKDKGLTKDDRAHGSLLVLQELLRCSNAEGERLLAELEQLNLLHSQTVQVEPLALNNSFSNPDFEYFLFILGFTHIYVI